jgi:beta-glucosidase
MKLKKLVTGSFFILVIFGLVSFGPKESKIEKDVEKLLKQLTLEEKIAMIHGSGIFTNGGVPRIGIPELRMSDGPVGVRMENNRDDWGTANWNNDNGAYFPAGTALAATWDTAFAYQMGKGLGGESVIRGKHVQLAPGVNIIRTPLCGRNWEYMSEDPYLISELVAPEILGMQSNNVAACLKHYALNNQEYERGSIDVIVDDRALREIYLPGFEAGVVQGKTLTVMGAYNKYLGQHATYNRILVQNILKGEWGFKGPVISDWAATHNTMEAAIDGLDIEMGTYDKGKFDNFFMAKPLLDSVKAGKVDVKVIDDKVRRILRVVLNLNILNEPAFDTTGMYAKQASKEKVEVALKVAQESIVLLKNNNSFLPLDFSKIKSIAVIGDNANREHAMGGGSTVVKARYEVTPLEALKKELNGKVTINYAKGYTAPPSMWSIDTTTELYNLALARQAVEVAKKSDIVLYFGGLNHNQRNDSEGADRLDMKLPYGQDILLNEIVKANPRTVVIILSGTPVEFGEWLDKIPALLHHSYLGMEAGNAIFNVLSGKVNPSGKLAMTFPKKLEDSPAHALGEYPGKNGKVHYNESIFVGYRYFDSKNIEPLFPFGYGLSYSKYEYGNISVPAKASSKNVKISFDIKNTGNIEGKEIAQVYVRDIESSEVRPLKELKAFAKLALKAGESKNVTLTLNENAFRFYSDKTKKWVVEPGKFEILVGSSSKDIKLAGTVDIK